MTKQNEPMAAVADTNVSRGLRIYGGVKVRQLPSGSWHAQVYAGRGPGGERITPLSITDSDPDEVGRQIIAFKKNRSRLKAGNFSVEEAVRRYISVREEHNGGAASVTTLAAYTRYADNHLDDLGAMQARSVTQEDMLHYKNHLAQKTTPKLVDGKIVKVKLSPKYVKNVCTLVTSAINEAIPGARLMLRHTKSKGKPRLVPSEQDMVRILQAAEGTPLFKAILLALCMGDRRSQICGLEYRDVDYRLCTVSIERAVVKDVHNALHEKPPKTEASIRVVKVSPEVVALLGHGEAREKVVKLKPSDISRGFAALVNGLGMAKYTFHSLRHFNASAMLALGVPNRYAQERGGWATDHVLKTVYQHTLDEKKAEVDDVCNSYFSGLLSQASGKPLHRRYKLARRLPASRNRRHTDQAADQTRV